MDNKPKKWIRLIEARKIRGYTQAQMAEACGVALLTYGRWESLKFEPSVSQIKSIAYFLEVPVGWLIGDVAFEPYSDAEYWLNVSEAKRHIAAQLADPESFLMKSVEKPIDRKTVVSWVTSKMGLPSDYFSERDLVSVFPDELQYAQGDNEEANRYFPVLPLKIASEKASRRGKK